MRCPRTVVILACLVLCASRAPAGDAPVTGIEALRHLGPVQADPERAWTIIGYFDADHNNERFALEDINDMEASLPEKGVEVIVLLDRAKEYSDADGDWTEARVFRIRRDEDKERIRSPILAWPGELNMGDPAVLGAFLGAALKTYPAPRVMFLIANHGGGWSAHCVDEEAPGAPAGKDRLTLPETREGIAKGLADGGRERLDILWLAECLMGQIETGAEFADQASLLLASEAIGWSDDCPYDGVIPLFAKPDADPREILVRIVDESHAAFVKRTQRVSTKSVVDLRAAGETIAALDRLVEKCRPALARSWPAFARSLFYAKGYAPRATLAYGSDSLASIDLLDGWRRIRSSVKPFPAEAEYTAFLEAMKRYIIVSKTSLNERASGGVAIYAPVAASQVHPDYARTRFAQRSRWPSFLSEIHRLEREDTSPARIRAAGLVDAGGNALASARPLARTRLAFTVEGKNVVWTQRWDGVQDPGRGGIRILRKGFVVDPKWPFRMKAAQEAGLQGSDIVMPEYIDGRNDLVTDIDGLGVRITNGETEIDATIQDANPDLGDMWRARALWTHPSVGDRVPVTVFFDIGMWNAASVTAELHQSDGSLVLSPVEPEPDARITFLSEVLAPDGRIAMVETGSLEWRKGLDLILAIDEPGEYVAVLAAETMAGIRGDHRFSYRMEPDPSLRTWAEGWKAARPEILAGAWDQFVLDEDGARIPTGVTHVIQRGVSDPRVYVGTAFFGAGGEKREVDVTWKFDVRGFPSVRIFEWDPEPSGLATGLYAGPGKFTLHPNGRATITAHMASFGGMVWLFERRERWIDPERYKPVPVPEPRPLE